MLHLEHSLLWCQNLHISESRSEIPGKLWNVELEKDGEDQFDRSCEKWKVLQRVKEDRNILLTIKGIETNWIGHIFRGNCLLNHVIDGNLEGKRGVKRRRGRRRKQLLDEPKEKRWYWKLKEQVLDRSLCGLNFERGYGPVVRQTRSYIYTLLVMTLHYATT